MGQRQAFHEMADGIFRLHEAGRYRDALARTEEITLACPDHADAMVYWRACFHALLGDPTRATAILSNGVENGLWWDLRMLTGDPDLASIREMPEFAEIVRVSEARLASARSSARPGLDVSWPLDATTPLPLLMALHWRGRSPADFNIRWQPATEHGVIAAFPRSSQATGMASYGWDDHTLALQELSDAYGRVMASNAVDPERVITGGASQGGALAIRLALAGEVIPALGFIAIVPAIRNAQFEAMIESAARRGVRGWVITGEHDYGRPDAEALHELLTEAGVACRLDVVAGLSHDFPRDFEERLPAVLDFVLDRSM